MGLLDDLKRQAQEIETRERSIAETIARNAAAVDRALRMSLRYLSDFAKQVNVLRPQSGRSFDLPRIGRFSGLQLDEFFTDYRTRNSFGAEQYDLVYLRYEQRTGEAIRLTMEFEDNIRLLERQLDTLGLNYRADYVKHDNKRLRHAEFVIEPVVRSRVILQGDHRSGKILLTLANVDGWGKRTLSLAAEHVSERVLEDLAKHILGQPSTLADAGGLWQSSSTVRNTQS